MTTMPEPAKPFGAAAPGTPVPWQGGDVRPLIRIEGVSKQFGGVTAVDDLTLDIAEREFFAMLGPSGCGKTTLLRLLAGFETPDSGRILLDGADITAVPPYLRPVNMMFQSYALFPHLSVAGNIAFGLKREGMARGLLEERVGEMVRLARLEGMEHRKPHQLSGGQRQRVALARALAKRPRVLLLDEPLAALDKKLREETQFELMDVQQRLGLTFIIVTHDQEEAMTLASRIGVMNRGRFVQVDAPRAVYEQPRSRYVAAFVGDINLLDGTVGQPGWFHLSEGGGVLAVETDGFACGTAASFAVRPEKLTLAPAGQGRGANVLAGRVVGIAYLGDLTVYRIALATGGSLRVSRANAEHSATAAFAQGDSVDVSFAAQAGLLLTD